MKTKLVFFDLETAPLTGRAWGTYETNLLEVLEDSYILCFTVKERGRKARVYSLRDYPLYKKEPANDRELVKELHKIFCDADILVAHNGDRFDIKVANARFIYHRLQPPMQYGTLDTLKIARKYFKFTSNKLNSLAQFLGLGEKVHTGGYSLWQGCIAGDERSWRRMERYNRMDVILLEKVYALFESWNVKRPGSKSGFQCPTPGCPGLRVQKRGFSGKDGKVRQNYQCLNCFKMHYEYL